MTFVPSVSAVSLDRPTTSVTTAYIYDCLSLLVFEQAIQHVGAFQNLLNHPTVLEAIH